MRFQAGGVLWRYWAALLSCAACTGEVTDTSPGASVAGAGSGGAAGGSSSTSGSTSTPGGSASGSSTTSGGTASGSTSASGASASGSSGGPGSGGSASGSTSVSGGSTNTTTECDNATKVVPGQSPVRRLNRFEYNNTISDVLKDDSAPADSFPLEEQSAFDNDANVLRVSRLLVEDYLDAARTLATTALAKPETLSCAAAAATADTATQEKCAGQLVDTWGPKLYRRPVAADERTRLIATFRTARGFLDFAGSARTVFETMLMSPQFLYRLETGTAVDGSPGVLKVDPWGLASRLSYFIWGSAPDDVLTKAAQEGRLVTAADVRREAERMYGSQRSRTVVRRFTRFWLELTNVDQQGKDATLFPDYTPAIGALMRTQTETLAEHLYFDSGGTLGEMLTAPYSYMNQTLAKFLGVSGPAGTAFEKVQLDPAKHSGVLTEPAFLSYNATVDRTHPILRGVFVMRKLLCTPPPDPPAGIVDGTGTVTDPNATQRDRLAAHRTNASCLGCHQFIDPIGLTFENFDAVGRFHDLEKNGNPVDASGSLSNTDVNGPVSNAIELTGKLAQSAQVQKCVTVNWFRYANGRGEVAGDTCSISRASVAMNKAGGSLRELVLALTQTDAFLYRVAPGAEVAP